MYFKVKTSFFNFNNASNCIRKVYLNFRMDQNRKNFEDI